MVFVFCLTGSSSEFLLHVWVWEYRHVFSVISAWHPSPLTCACFSSSGQLSFCHIAPLLMGTIWIAIITTIVVVAINATQNFTRVVSAVP